MAAQLQDSAALRRRLRTELRDARNTAGLTQRDVARRLEWSPSKVIRIESGQVAISTVDLRALLREYGVNDMGRIEQLVELARNSKKQSWSQYRDVLNQDAMDYFGYEASAYIVRQYETLLVPGLLQVEDYSREILRKAYGRGDTGVERLVDARKVRQELLDRDDHPQMFFVLDEAVIRRQVGGADVMKGQLDHLIELSERDGISIQVFPFLKGAYQGMAGPFAHLEFAGGEDDVLFLEGRTDAVLKDDEEDRNEVSRHLEIFQELEFEATDKKEFARLMKEAKAALGA
jgi:transcriptional regulator with XRE-family HTH domain